MEYKFSDIEAQIQSFWREKEIYKVSEQSGRPPFYVLDMFPYPLGRDFMWDIL